MATIIHLKPEAVWDFFERNEERLNKEMVLIAENTNPDEKVYLSCENNLPYVYFFKDGQFACSEGMVSYMDAKTTTLSYYNMFSPPKEEPDEEEDDKEPTEDDVLDEIYEREDALYFALRDFLEIVLDSDEETVKSIDTDTFDELMDGILNEIADHDLPVYRPTFYTEEDTGTEYLVAYPYAK